jgi:hypothetical protein
MEPKQTQQQQQQQTKRSEEQRRQRRAGQLVNGAPRPPPPAAGSSRRTGQASQCSYRLDRSEIKANSGGRSAARKRRSTQQRCCLVGGWPAFNSNRHPRTPATRAHRPNLIWRRQQQQQQQHCMQALRSPEWAAATFSFLCAKPRKREEIQSKAREASRHERIIRGGLVEIRSIDRSINRAFVFFSFSPRRGPRTLSLPPSSFPPFYILVTHIKDRWWW